MAEPDQPPKPGPKRKRQLAAFLFLTLLVSYPLSAGPWCYAIGRGLIPLSARRTSYWFYRPAQIALNLIPARNGYTLADRWHDWQSQCFNLGERQRHARPPF